MVFPFRKLSIKQNKIYQFFQKVLDFVMCMAYSIVYLPIERTTKCVPRNIELYTYAYDPLMHVKYTSSVDKFDDVIH